MKPVTIKFDFDLTDNSLGLEEQIELIQASQESEEGELLRFRNAVLARAEVNKNKDGLSGRNIDELAATLPLMPINMEHVGKQVVGFFTSARNVSNSLVVDGIIFARHFPDIVEKIKTKALKLSIEGVSLNAEVKNGVRWFENLKAIGGALTERPAGTDTGFHNSSTLIIASKNEENPEMEEKIKELQATIESLNAKIKELESAKVEASEKGEKIAELETKIEELNASLESARQKIDEVAAHERVSATRAAALMASGRSKEDVEEMWAELGSMSEKVFAMLIEKPVATPAPLKAKEVEGEDEGEGEAKPVVIASIKDDDQKQDATPEFVF